MTAAADLRRLLGRGTLQDLGGWVWQHQQLLLAALTDDAPAAKVGRNSPDTSNQAALDNLPRSGTQRRQVLRFVLTVGEATDEQIQAGTGLSANTERPRRIELVEGHWLYDSRERTRNANGNEVIVWRPTTKAKQARILNQEDGQ